MRAVVSVDVGGTFTDVVVLREDGLLYFFKVPSTPREPEKAVAGVLKRLEGLEVTEVLHATTIATNALLGQVGLELPKVALVTTKGFRDVVEIGRQNRPRLYDLFFEKPRQLVPRSLRFEVDERVDAWGRVLREPSEEELERVARAVAEAGAVSAAVSFLHSYANPSNEKKAKAVLEKHVEYVSASHEVAPEPREYERTSTTVVNAALMPIVARYVRALRKVLGELGAPRLLIMSSSGGLVDEQEAAARPVQLVESGPAAGVVAAAELAKAIGEPRVISFDMGGTTAKAGTVVDYEVGVTTEYEVGGRVHHGRVVKGSGYPVRFPFIDLAEVSAGGGTIIWRDEAGALRVGPLSAGAEPGPACYGRGGAEPTVTDANLYLGRIPDVLAGGALVLSKKLAEESLKKLGDPEEVAVEALRLVNLEMARAIRLVTVERGLDPAEFALVAFGGAGPQHAAEVAVELGVKKVVVPPEPGNFSALGLLLADWKLEARSSYPRDLEAGYQELEKRVVEKMGHVDYFARFADVRYRGQGWELTVPVPRPATIEDVKKAFAERHLKAYGFTLSEEVEVVTIRVFGVRKRPIDIGILAKHAAKAGEKPVPRASRRAYVLGEWVAASIYHRSSLGPGQVVEGPAIVEEPSSTTLIPQGWVARVGRYGELHLEVA
ncbi:MAG: hydantoinase/oxoprolinase family protein [Desulfurococcaceae archaeon]